MFADGALAGRVALVTGGGTNLGKAAALELARCGAEVVIAGRREEVLDRGRGRDRGSLRSRVRRHPHRRGCAGDRSGSARPSRPAGPAAQQRRRSVLRSRRGDHRQGMGCGAAAQRGGDAGDVRGRPRAGDAPGGDRDDRQRDGFPASRHAGDGAHRRGPGGGRGAHQGAGGELDRRRRRGCGRGPRAAWPPSPCASIRPSCGAAPPARCRCSASARWRSTAGWSRSWPRRWAGRCRARWSPSTARSTTGRGRGPRRSSPRDGEVPTEERRPVT